MQFSAKRRLLRAGVGASTMAGVVVGAVPVPIADALILTPIEVGEINVLARLYDIDKGVDSKRLLNSIVEVGTASIVAKTAISALKAIPGINIAASVLNAVIAGSFVAAIGEGSIYVFEKIYLGEKSVADIDWVTKIMESKLSSELVEKVTRIIKEVAEKGSPKDASKVIADLLAAAFGSSGGAAAAK
jgi:uncharacterized protein (DUF697 family)